MTQVLDEPQTHAEPAAAATLTATDLTVNYGGVVALDGASVVVEPGRIVGLIGPNGAGKTTFIDALSGFVQPARGTVHLGAHDLSRISPHRRAQRGLIRSFQHLELFNDLTVAENIAVASRTITGRAATGHVARVVELFDLQPLLKRDVSELSQGQRHLVALARAVACDPKVLLLDEPAAGLDTNESLVLARFIRDLANSGVGVLLIDHDMSLVLSICDRITVINFGRPLAEGTPSEIRANADVVSAYLGED